MPLAVTSVLTWREHGMRGDLFQSIYSAVAALIWQAGQSYVWGVRDEDYFSAETSVTSPRVRWGGGKKIRDFLPLQSLKFSVPRPLFCHCCCSTFTIAPWGRCCYSLDWQIRKLRQQRILTGWIQSPCSKGCILNQKSMLPLKSKNMYPYHYPTTTLIPTELSVTISFSDWDAPHIHYWVIVYII